MSRLLTFLALALLLGACSFELGIDPIVDNSCKDDNDCVGDATCNPDVGMCVARTPEHVYQIGMLVTPAPEGVAGGIVLPRVLGAFPVEGPTTQNLNLAPPIRVFGNISCPSCELTGPLRADVTFRRPSPFAGAPESVFEADTFHPATMAADGELANYAVALLAERDYEVLVRPTGDTAAILPPLRLIVPTPGGGDFWRFEITYPETYAELNGTLVDAEGTPINGLRIVAIDSETGEQVSSAAQTGSDETPSGSFTLVLGPDANGYALQISGGADKPLFPTLTIGTGALFPDPEGNVEILVPTLGCVDYIGEVGRASDAMSDERVAEATVSFRAIDIVDADTGFTGSFRTTTTTDAEGRFAVRLPVSQSEARTEGSLNYEVVISPPTGGSEDAPTSVELGVLSETVSIGRPTTLNLEGCGDAGPKLFEVPDRARFNGTVLTSDERVMPGVTVQAVPLGQPFPEGHPFERASVHNRSSDSTSGATGQFELQLDVGTYDLIIKPPLESGFPWFADPGFTIGADGSAGVFEFGAPVTFSGVVTTRLGEETIPLGGAVIDTWALVDGEEGVRAVPIGRTTTDENGNYMLLLPARLPQ